MPVEEQTRTVEDQIRTIDLVRQEFEKSSLNATDIAKRADLKPDQGRRILNRRGGTSEETAQVLLKAIREMIAERNPEKAQGRKESENLPSANMTAEKFAPRQEGNALPQDPEIKTLRLKSSIDQISKIPEPVKVKDLDRASFGPQERHKRSLTQAPFPGMELGAKVPPEAHDISPFDVFEKVENDLIIRENARKRAEERAALELIRQQEEETRQKISETADDLPPQPLEKENAVSETVHADEDALNGSEDKDSDAEVSVAESGLSETIEVLQDEAASEAEVEDVSFRIVASKPKDGICRLILEGDVPQEKVDQIIAMFLREKV